MDKIIITLSPVERFHRIYIFKEGNLVDQIGVELENIAEIVNDYAAQYDINDISLGGAKAYTQKIAQDLTQYNLAHYTNKLNISFVEG